MTDVVLTFTPQMLARAQAALGNARNLRTPDTPAVLDAQGKVVTPLVPGVPRPATPAEVKQFVIDTLRSLVWQQEQQVAVKAATDAVAPPANFDPT
jgi:hypothetical protein